MSRAITAEDVYRWKWVSDPQMSPDGKQIAYVVKTIDQEAGEYRHAIWVVPTDGQIGDARRFTYGPKNDHSPRWSPDGAWLAFISDREGEGGKDAKEDKARGKGKPQLWKIPADGGEAQQLTFLRNGASHPVWSPDGKYLAFTSKTGGEEEPDEAEGKKKMPKSRKITRLWYRLDGVGWVYEQRKHIFILSAEGGEPRQLTDGDWDDDDVAWSPDGQHIAFFSDRSEDRWELPSGDIWVVPVVAGEPYCLTDDGTLAAAAPSWSPDGKTIAFLGTLQKKSGGHVDLYTVPAERAPGSPVHYRLLTPDFVGTCMDWLGDDMRDEHGRPAPKWSPDGSTLYFLATVAGSSHAFSLPTSGGTPKQLTQGEAHLLDFNVDKAGTALSLALAEYNHPGDIFAQPVHSGERRRLTEGNADWLSDIHIAKPERVEFAGAQGWTVEGWVLKPADFDPAKKYPMILEIHGGPNTAYGYTFHQEFQMLAGKGYVVLYTNPRGSIGYGREFSVAVRGIWGKEDYEDIMAGVDALLKQGYVDAQQLGVTGGSYGGYMTNWIISHTDRFKAAVTQRSVTNLATMFGTSDIGPDLCDDNFEVTPWDDPERYAFHSPITYVKNITAPLLILHSDWDLRCPIEQAEQLYTALKYLHREVEFVRFEGQSHGLSRGGHPKLRVERLNLIAGWFQKYLPAK
jgi:dipeptidyl aminopeptidase/acylaminoacyl peptidase